MNGEDYNKLYGMVDYKNKTVLDIGADWGSTAIFFLVRGAEKVIAVEADESLYEKLVEIANWREDVTGVKKKISNQNDFKELIMTYSPDIVKVDCEGCEQHLLDLDDTIEMVDSYVIETHWKDETAYKIMEKLKSHGFKIIRADRWFPIHNLWMIYAQK